jgi:hypothetical protein
MKAGKEGIGQDSTSNKFQKGEIPSGGANKGDMNNT